MHRTIHIGLQQPYNNDLDLTAILQMIILIVHIGMHIRWIIYQSKQINGFLFHWIKKRECCMLMIESSCVYVCSKLFTTKKKTKQRRHPILIPIRVRNRKKSVFHYISWFRLTSISVLRFHLVGTWWTFLKNQLEFQFNVPKTFRFGSFFFSLVIHFASGISFWIGNKLMVCATGSFENVSYFGWNGNSNVTFTTKHSNVKCMRK